MGYKDRTKRWEWDPVWAYCQVTPRPQSSTYAAPSLSITCEVIILLARSGPWPPGPAPVPSNTSLVLFASFRAVCACFAAVLAGVCAAKGSRCQGQRRRCCQARKQSAPGKLVQYVCHCSALKISILLIREADANVVRVGVLQVLHERHSACGANNAERLLPVSIVSANPAGKPQIC